MLAYDFLEWGKIKNLSWCVSDLLQPDVHPGNCWAFRGSKGFLVIHLSMRILPTAVSLEHIPKALAPSGTLRSAPRDFSVYVRASRCQQGALSGCRVCLILNRFCFQGLDDESQEEGELLGTYTYDEDGEALQTFAVTVSNDCTLLLFTCC